MASKQQKNAGDKRRTVRVAIVGGGCSGLAAAWELSQRNLEPGDVKFDIAVYEKSWRLGGKGASVRDRHGRIREHGLHVWMGFYENAFYLMRECYAYLKAQNLATGPYDSIDKAFFPEPHLGAAVRNRAGQWEDWTGFFPPAVGEPGTPIDANSNPFSLSSYIAHMLGMVKTLMHSIIEPVDGNPPQDRRQGAYPWNADSAPDQATDSMARPDGRSALDGDLDLQQGTDPSASPAAQVASIARLLRVGGLATAAGLLQSLSIVQSFLREQSSLSMPDIALLQYLEAIVAQSRRFFADLAEIDEDVRRRTEIIDLVMTIIVGLFRDRVLLEPDGLDALNDIDCQDWLIKHGATYASVESPFMRALYDLAFAYRDGDKRFPALAAGQALRGALRMFFGYRGAMVYRMRAGMGDVVFAPLYRALERRGVKFYFNHTLKEVKFNGLSETGSNRVTALEFNVDYEPKAARGKWSPLERGFWPESAANRFKPLATRAPLTLTADSTDAEGFDAVVLALGKDGFVAACPKLCDELERYKQMRAHVTTVATQAVQLWFKDEVSQLQWHGDRLIMTGLDSPLDSWADMAHTLAAERNVRYQNDGPKAVVYLCGVLEESKVKKAIEEEKQRQGQALKVLEDGIRETAHQVLEKEEILNQLVSPAREGAKAFEEQHFKANYDGSDRYALSLPGTLKHRVSPLDGSVENMTIAGDWTDCGFNEGCVEAAVMSGRLAAHALTGERPSLDDIVGYNHP